MDAEEFKQMPVSRHRGALPSEVKAFTWLFGLPFADDTSDIEAFPKCDW
jgi:transposase